MQMFHIVIDTSILKNLIKIFWKKLKQMNRNDAQAVNRGLMIFAYIVVTWLTVITDQIH